MVKMVESKYRVKTKDFIIEDLSFEQSVDVFYKLGAITGSTQKLPNGDCHIFGLKDGKENLIGVIQEIKQH
jgi:hypothetical protein